MKKNDYCTSRKFGGKLKLLIIMKLALLIIAVTLIQVNAAVYSQNGKFSLTAEDTQIKDVLKELEDNSTYRFFYTDNLVFLNNKVNFKMRNSSVEEVLDKLLLKSPLTYKIFDNHLVVILPITESEQQHAVKGKVTDSEGNPLPGVNIVEVGTTNGAVTDLDGNYSITVSSEDAVLSFSFIGYLTEQIEVGGQTRIEVTLVEDIQALDEVVVVGYGTIKKSDLTGAVASVGEDDLASYPSSNAVQALQGRAAGVTVQMVNGEPGGDYKIRVRGATSINASSNPLVVVDGLVGGSMPPPEDIASIEVLKDASATAIYGSRGANGVIMVSTKLGKSGETNVNINSYYSFQNEIGRMDVLNAREFAEYINDARGTEFYDLNNISIDTDWQDLVFQQGYVQNHQLSISGGNEKLQYYASGIYYDQKGVIKTSTFDRYSLTSNLKYKLSDRIRINLNSILQGSMSNGVITQGGSGPTNSGVINAAQRFDPNQGIVDENGKYTQSKVGIAAFENPMAVIDGRDEENRRDNIQVNLKAEFDILEGLTFNSTFGTIIRNSRNGVYNNKKSNLGEITNGRANLSYGRNSNFLTEQYLNYDFNVGDKNNFVITSGYSYQKFNNESFSASNNGFTTDALGFWNLGAGTNLQIPNSSYSASEIASFYGRFNYNFGNRYLLTLTGRYDGASQFSDDNKWSFFPSGALSWNVHNENFWPQNGVITAFKLRGSYGLTGNQAIGAYQSLARISNTFFVINNNSVSSVRPTSIANKDLTWETTSQYNIGTDLGFFERRLIIFADYYYKKTEDLLFSVPIPAFSGFQRRLENLGSIENKGFEFQLESKNLVNKFQWTTSFNLTLNRNKVLELPESVDIIYSSAPSSIGGRMETSILREGEPVGSFYGFVYEGVYQEGNVFIAGGGFETEPGGEKFADINGDEVLNNSDREIIGNPNPKAVWGLNNDFSYKGFYLNVFLQAYTGADMMNLVKMDLDRLSGNTNATTDALKRWSPENTNTAVPKAFAGRVSRVSSRFVEDGSFVRLKNISLGYDFNQAFLNKLKVSSARVYISGQNVLTFTEYSGVDPEVAYMSNNVNLGLDYDSYPNTKSWTLGINIGF